MKRRLLSAFLAVMMVLTMAPVAFAADEGGTTGVAKIGDVEYPTLQAAIDAANNGDTIVLKKSISATEIGEKKQLQFVKADMNVTLDLNQNTITAEAGEAIAINAANITLTVKNGTIENFAEGSYSDGVYAYKESNNLTLTFENIVLKSRTQGLAVQGLTSNSNVNIVNSNITSTEELGIYYPPKSGTLTISDSEITGVTGIVVKGSNLVVKGEKTIISGTGPNVDPETYYTGATDGSSSLTETGDAVYVESGYNDRDISVSISGGHLNSKSAKAVRMFVKNGENTSAKRDISVTGGTFSSDVSAYCDANYATEKNADNTYTVKPLKDVAVAQVGDTYYKTLAEAVSAADKNTVTLLKNTAEDVVIPADKTVTLDLNGKKLTNVQSDTITVTKGAKLTIAGKGTVDNVTNGKAAVYNNGTTTLNGGKYTRSAEADNTTSSSGGNSYYNILNHGAMTINEGVEVYSSGHFSSLVANGYYDYSATQKGDRTAYIESVGQAAPELTINDGKFSGGINTIKNDDNATLTINSGEFSNVTQAVVQNNNIATVNGGTFDADGYHALENWKYNSNYNAGNLTVTNGKFAGSIVTNAAVSLKISGGLYTENPSKYLAASVKDGYKYAAVKHASPYLFEVKEILNENVEVIPNVGAAKAKSAEGVVDKDDVAKVDAAAKVVAAPKISEAAAVVADKVDAEQYTEKATNITKADRIEVRAYLEVTPKEYSADSYKLNITPKYDIVVVGTDNKEQKFTGDTLPVSNETPVSVQLPDGFVKNTDSLYVQHKGHEYNADVSVNTVKVNGVDKNIYTAKFNNPDGFSDFTITKTTQSVAVIGNNKYTTLQNAIDAAQTGATIVLQKDCTEKVTVAGKSLTINRNGKTFNEANVTVGSNCTKEVKNDTIVVTYTKPSSGGSSGGSSSGKTTYKVTTSAVNNGGVNASPSNAEKGATITITLSPDKGYKLDKLTVTDGSGKTVSTVKKSDTVYTFTMPASAVKVGVSYVKATETPSKTKFNDVSANDWFASAVDYVTGKGMMNGTADNTFSPKANTTRGMVVTVLYRLENQPSTSAASFTDVASGAYYANAVAWANANGIVSGYGSGKFGPNDKVTREQLAAILYRYAQYKKYDVSVGEDTNILSYDDAQSISTYAIPAIQWACGAGVVTGKSGSKLDPKGNATRAEVAAMLMRFCENVK